MIRRLDLERVRSALQKAAKNATSGSTEVRSGRFLPKDSTTGRFAEKTSVFRQNSDPKIKASSVDLLKSTDKQ